MAPRMRSRRERDERERRTGRSYTHAARVAFLVDVE
jgi:hypothetical protein